MDWNKFIEEIYEKNSELIYKSSMLKYPELLKRSYEKTIVDIESVIKKSIEKNGHQTPQIRRLIAAIDNTEDTLEQSRERILQNFNDTFETNSISKLEKHMQSIADEEYFELINAERGNGDLSAFLNKQIPKIKDKSTSSLELSLKTNSESSGEVSKIDNILNMKKSSFSENNNKQLIIDGAPGTGKSYNLNKEIKDNDIAHERVTFYQDYEYHNFVGSILPVLNGGTVSYEFVQGPFTKILNGALANPEDKHYLVIEELTRGNASAIFGDVFQLLDRDDNGFSQYPISHENVLNSLDPEVKQFLINEFDGKVVLPPNLSIVCTINSSDQNVFPLDTAFKRRFDYEIKSTNVDRNEFDNFDIHFGMNDEGYAISIDLIEFQEKLNEFILVNLGLKEDKQVGPYFIKNYNEDADKLKSIQTKLAMYLWNDLHKVHTISNQYIFNDKVQTLSKVDELFRTGSKADILNVLSPEFKKHFGLD